MSWILTLSVQNYRWSLFILVITVYCNVSLICNLMYFTFHPKEYLWSTICYNVNLKHFILIAKIYLLTVSMLFNRLNVYSWHLLFYNFHCKHCEILCRCCHFFTWFHQNENLSFFLSHSSCLTTNHHQDDFNFLH